MSKKNENPYNDMEDTMPMKKFPGKKKDKNWKNHLLDKDENESVDISSLEDFKGFDDSIDEESEEDS